MPLDYFVWVIRSGERTIVVDTGFDAAAAAQRGRTLLRPVAAGLAAIGVRAAEVRDVVITHMHYDHAGNVPLFPKARFHVQDAEMAYCTGRAMTHPHLAGPFDAENVVDMVRRIFDGRVVFHAGDEELCPGVTLHHLPGSNTAFFTSTRWFVLPGIMQRHARVQLLVAGMKHHSAAENATHHVHDILGVKGSRQMRVGHGPTGAVGRISASCTWKRALGNSGTLPA